MLTCQCSFQDVQINRFIFVGSFRVAQSEIDKTQIPDAVWLELDQNIRSSQISVNDIFMVHFSDHVSHFNGDFF